MKCKICKNTNKELMRIVVIRRPNGKERWLKCYRCGSSYAINKKRSRTNKSSTRRVRR